MDKKTLSSANNADLKTENELLKIKLMLEQGAVFNREPTNEIDPAVENFFLNQVIAFERQFQQHKTIKVFDRLKRPANFIKVGQIGAGDIKNAWEDLFEYMVSCGVELTVCSPNIDQRELYRFAVEELFHMDMDDIDLPGMICCFTYDDYYPDHKYDNTRIAVEDCMENIFSRKDYEWMHHFRGDGLQLNEHHKLSKEIFKIHIDAFQQQYQNFEHVDLRVFETILNQDSCLVNGSFEFKADTGKGQQQLQGKWSVTFALNNELKFWEIVKVEVKGIAL